ncbi:hypothetical protein Gogos_010409, partial [Gossypium gossypioides]|nr:hypothetical protein [Gossypium gossypioides]
MCSGVGENKSGGRSNQPFEEKSRAMAVAISKES